MNAAVRLLSTILSSISIICYIRSKQKPFERYV